MTQALLLTAREVRARLRIGRNAIYALAKDREISSVRIGSKLLFLESEVEAYVKRRTTPAKRNFFGTKSVSHTTQNKEVAGVGQSNYGR